MLKEFTKVKKDGITKTIRMTDLTTFIKKGWRSEDMEVSSDVAKEDLVKEVKELKESLAGAQKLNKELAEKLETAQDTIAHNEIDLKAADEKIKLFEEQGGTLPPDATPEIV